MKYLKKYENYSTFYFQEIKKIEDNMSNLKNKIISDIDNWMKKNKLSDVDFFYNFTNEDEIYYTNINVTANEIMVFVRDYATNGLMTKLYYDGNDLIALVMIDNGEYDMMEYEHFLRYMKLRDVAEILNYLEEMTPDMIEQQKIHRESNKFNL